MRPGGQSRAEESAWERAIRERRSLSCGDVINAAKFSVVAQEEVPSSLQRLEIGAFLTTLRSVLSEGTEVALTYIFYPYYNNNCLIRSPNPPEKRQRERRRRREDDIDRTLTPGHSPPPPGTPSTSSSSSVER